MTPRSSFRLEIAALCIAAILLIVSCFYTANALRSVTPLTPASSLKTIEAFNVIQYEDLAEKLQSPLPWLFCEHKLFVSRILTYSFDTKTLQPLDLSKTGSDLIPYTWKRDHGFSIEDTAAALSDADQDGFTNFEEFQSHTDPRDMKSSPPPVLKLRMEKYQAIPFKFVFKGYTVNPDNTYNLQINVDSDKGPQTLFIKKGDRLKFDDSSWEVGDFRIKVEKRLNPSTNLEQEFDESEIDLLRNGLNQIKTVLVKNQSFDSLESKVSLVSLIPSEEKIPLLMKGSIFTFCNEEYLLISADNTGAIIKNLDTGKEFRIPIITREERSSTMFRDEKEKKK